MTYPNDESFLPEAEYLQRWQFSKEQTGIASKPYADTYKKLNVDLRKLMKAKTEKKHPLTPLYIRMISDTMLTKFRNPYDDNFRVPLHVDNYWMNGSNTSGGVLQENLITDLEAHFNASIATERAGASLTPSTDAEQRTELNQDIVKVMIKYSLMADSSEGEGQPRQITCTPISTEDDGITKGVRILKLCLDAVSLGLNGSLLQTEDELVYYIKKWEYTFEGMRVALTDEAVVDEESKQRIKEYNKKFKDIIHINTNKIESGNEYTRADGQLREHSGRHHSEALLFYIKKMPKRVNSKPKKSSKAGEHQTDFAIMEGRYAAEMHRYRDFTMYSNQLGMGTVTFPATDHITDGFSSAKINAKPVSGCTSSMEGFCFTGASFTAANDMRTYKEFNRFPTEFLDSGPKDVHILVKAWDRDINLDKQDTTKGQWLGGYIMYEYSLNDTSYFRIPNGMLNATKLEALSKNPDEKVNMEALSAMADLGKGITKGGYQSNVDFTTQTYLMPIKLSDTKNYAIVGNANYYT